MNRLAMPIALLASREGTVMMGALTARISTAPRNAG
jgi:hypothetical protein